MLSPDMETKREMNRARNEAFLSFSLGLTNESAARKAEAQFAEDRKLYDKLEAQVAAREAELAGAVTSALGQSDRTAVSSCAFPSVEAAFAAAVASGVSAVTEAAHHHHRLSPEARRTAAAELNTTWPGRSTHLASLITHLAPAAEVAPLDAGKSITDNNGNTAADAIVQRSSVVNEGGTLLGLSGCPPLVVQGPPGQGKRGLLRAVLDAYCVRHVWVNVDRVLPLRGPGQAPYTAPQLASLLFGEILGGLDAAELTSSAVDRASNADHSKNELSERKKRKLEKKAKEIHRNERSAQVDTGLKGERSGEILDTTSSRNSSSSSSSNTGNVHVATAAMDIEGANATTAGAARTDAHELSTVNIEEEDEEAPQQATARLRRGAHRWAAAHVIDYSGRPGSDGSNSKWPKASSGNEIDGADSTSAAAAYGCRDALSLVDALSDVLPPVFDVVGTGAAAETVALPEVVSPSERSANSGQANAPAPFVRPDVEAPPSNTQHQLEHVLPKGFRAPAPRVVFVMARAERLLEPDCAPAASWLLPQLQLVCGLLLEQQQEHLRKVKRKQAISAARRDAKAATDAAARSTSAVADLLRAKDHAKLMAAAAGIAESSEDSESVAAQTLANSEASAQAWAKLATRARAGAGALKARGVWRSWRLQLAFTVAEHPGLMHGGLSKLRGGQLLGRPPVAVVLGAYGRPEPLAGVLRVEVRRLRRTRAPGTTMTTSDTSSGAALSDAIERPSSSTPQDEARKLWSLSEAFAERMEALVVNQLVLATSGVSNLRILRRAAVELCDALVAQQPELRGALRTGNEVPSEEIAVVVRPLLKQLLPRALDEMHNADFSLAVASLPKPHFTSSSSNVFTATPKVAAALPLPPRSSVAKALTASLPARQRLLLVAAFVASNSPADLDKEKFTPAQKGRKRQKREKQGNQTGLAGVMGSHTKSGPAPVDLERLLAIYDVFWGQYGSGSKGSNNSHFSSDPDLDVDPEKWVEWQWHGGGGASSAGSAAVLGHITSLVRSGLLEHVPPTRSSSSALETRDDSSDSSARKGKGSSSEANAFAESAAAAASALGAVDLGRARYRCVVGKFLVEQLATAFGLPLDRYLRSTHTQ